MTKLGFRGQQRQLENMTGGFSSSTDFTILAKEGASQAFTILATDYVAINFQAKKSSEEVRNNAP